MIKAVLFDLDGVLINSVETWHKSLNKTLRNFDKKEITFDYYRKFRSGKTVSSDIRDFFGELTKEKFLEIKNFYYSQFISSIKDIEINPESLAVLSRLKETKKLGLVTNSTKTIVDNLFLYFNFYRYFDTIVNGSMGSPKPSPDLILMACKDLGVAPEEGIYIGDTTTDIQAARAAGMKAIFYSEDSEAEADYNARFLSDILTIIDSADNL